MFFLVNKRENSWGDEQPHTLPILGDNNISLYHTGCFPQSDCNSSYHHSSPHSACQCIETKSASNLHETICMQWWNWFFHSGYFTLEAPMSLQVRHLDSSGHTAAVLGRGYMPTFSMFVPFLQFIISNLSYMLQAFIATIWMLWGLRSVGTCT